MTSRIHHQIVLSLRRFIGQEVLFFKTLGTCTVAIATLFLPAHLRFARSKMLSLVGLQDKKDAQVDCIAE